MSDRSQRAAGDSLLLLGSHNSLVVNEALALRVLVPTTRSDGSVAFSVRTRVLHSSQRVSADSAGGVQRAR